jgi:hypothetical protein
MMSYEEAMNIIEQIIDTCSDADNQELCIRYCHVRNAIRGEIERLQAQHLFDNESLEEQRAIIDLLTAQLVTLTKPCGACEGTGKSGETCTISLTTVELNCPACQGTGRVARCVVPDWFVTKITCHLTKAKYVMNALPFKGKVEFYGLDLGDERAEPYDIAEFTRIPNTTMWELTEANE